MEEVEIVISVNSDEAVAGTEKEIAALKDLEAQAGKTSDASSKRSQKAQKDLSDEAKKYDTATQIVAKHRAEIDKLAKAEETRRTAGTRARGAGGKFVSDADQAKSVATEQRKITQAMQNELRSRTGYTITELNKQTSARESAARKQLSAEQQLSRALDTEVSKRVTSQARGQQKIEAEAVKGRTKALNETRKLMSDIERAEDDSYSKRTSRLQKFTNDIERFMGGGGSRGGGGSFLSGGGSGGGPVRRNQLSRNRFVDFGGRGVQPRTLGIGSLVGLAGIAAGPVGAAAGGLLGAVPGAAFGIGSAAAAIKMSGIGQLAGDAAKIKTIQDQIAAGVTKEAKGRAQIAAIMKGLTPEQQKGLALWQGFQKVTADIGKNVQDKLLPAFGNIGKAISADAPIIARSIETAGGAMANLLTNFSGFISKGAGKALFAGTAGAGNTFITGLMSSLGDLGKAFLGIGNASQKFMHQMSDMGNALTKSFAGWTTSSGGQAQLKAFFAVAAQEIPRVLGLFKDLGKVLFTIFAAALPFANQFIDAVRNALQNFNKFLQSARGQSDMKNLFKDIGVAIKGVVSIVTGLWPVFSSVFDKIKGIVSAVSGIFGTKFSTAFALVGGYFASKMLGPIMDGLTAIAKKMLVLSVTNPWVAAAVGTTVLLVYLSTLKTNLQDVATAARNTANDIKGVFSAISDKKSTQLDLKTLGLQKSVQQGSIFDLGKKIKGEQTKGKTSGFTPGLNAQIQNDQLALARLRQAYNATVSSIADDTKKIGDDNKEAAAKVKKAHDDMEKAYSSALKSTQSFTGNTPRSGGGPAFTPPNFSKAEAAFNHYFKTVDAGAGQSGQRVRLAMDKIAAFAAKEGHLPSAKWVSLMIKDLASKTIQQITLALQKLPNQKMMKIIADNKQALQSIADVADKNVKDKHFSIIGAVIAPNVGNPFKTVTPIIPSTRTPTASAAGGVVAGMGGTDSVPMLLQPGEVVLNRRQQYDFGGPQQFHNYFSSQKMATGGVVKGVGEGGIDNLIAKKAPIPTVTYDGPKGHEVKVTLTPAQTTGGGASQPTATDAEPGWDAVVALLKSKAPAQKMWADKLKWDTLSYNSINDDYLAKDYVRRTQLGAERDRLRGDKSKSATAKRTVIALKEKALALRIDRELLSKRRTADLMHTDRLNLTAAKKVYSHIPGYDAFEGILNSVDATQAGLEWQAEHLPAYDPLADPSAPNGLTTLTNAWNNINNAYQGTVSADNQAYQTRVAWLSGLVPQLANRPHYASVANAEIVSDQRDSNAIYGKSLAEQLASGTGPGDTITGGATTNTDWSKDQSTVQFTGLIAADAATIAMSLLNNDANSWTSAMGDEAAAYLRRLSDLSGAKDNPLFSSMRTDILDEITNDAGTYQDIKTALAAGFGAAQGGDTGSNDQQVQDVIDSANALMSQVNVGTTVEREQLGLLTQFLSSQVPSHEVGAQYVGRTGMAMIHQGEKITPRGDVRHDGYGGGGTLTIDGSGKLGKLLAEHMTYEQGQSSRRRTRERRR